MYFSSLAAISCIFLSSPGLGAPQAPYATTATVQLANDQIGAHADVVIPVDGQKYAVQDLWGNTAVASQGRVYATSIQFIAHDQSAVCTFVEEPLLQVTLNSQTTWASFGATVDLCAAYVSCECDMEW